MMPEESVATQVSGVEKAIEGHYRHNFMVNVMDGTSFWFGYSFIAPGVILPLYVSHFTLNPLVIGLVAVISFTLAAISLVEPPKVVTVASCWPRERWISSERCSSSPAVAPVSLGKCSAARVRHRWSPKGTWPWAKTQPRR